MKVFAMTSIYQTSPNNPKTGARRAAKSARRGRVSAPAVSLSAAGYEQGRVIVTRTLRVSSSEEIRAAREALKNDKTFTSL